MTNEELKELKAFVEGKIVETGLRFIGSYSIGPHTILALIEHIESIAADAERLDWLERRVVSVYHAPHHSANHMFAASHNGPNGNGPDLRKKIDAAILKEKA